MKEVKGAALRWLAKSCLEMPRVTCGIAGFGDEVFDPADGLGVDIGTDEGCAGASANGKRLDSLVDLFLQVHELGAALDDEDIEGDSGPHDVVDALGLELQGGGRVSGNDFGEGGGDGGEIPLADEALEEGDMGRVGGVEAVASGDVFAQHSVDGIGLVDHGLVRFEEDVDRNEIVVFGLHGCYLTFCLICGRLGIRLLRQN
jgi:hypothetical protein